MPESLTTRGLLAAVIVKACYFSGLIYEAVDCLVGVVLK